MAGACKCGNERAGNFLTNGERVSFSGRTLLHGVSKQVWSWDSSVGLATELLTGRQEPWIHLWPGVRDFLLSPKLPDRFWEPPSPLICGFLGLLPGQGGRGVKPTSHHLFPS